MADLFVYGTLMCADILRAVAGTLPARTEAVLSGYRRFAVRGERYPGIVAVADATVTGLVCFDVEEESWRRLDRFEGEMYSRRLVTVRLKDGTPREAYAYVVRREFADRLEAEEWSFEMFKKSGKGDFIDNYEGYGTLE